MAKLLAFAHEAHYNGTQHGTNASATTAGGTLSPAERSLVLPKPGGVPTITDAGVTASKQIELEDPLDGLEAELDE